MRQGESRAVCLLKRPCRLMTEEAYQVQRHIIEPNCIDIGELQ
jgi:hypothetical protein